MENKTKKPCPGSAVQATRLDRATARLMKLQSMVSAARERRREEAARQERIAKLRERQRIEGEQRFLGRLCRLAGLDQLRQQVSGGTDDLPKLDAELLAGALRLLAQQVRQCGAQDTDQLRLSGRALLGADLKQTENEVMGDEV